MSYFAIVALVNTLSSAILGLIVYLKNKKGDVNRTFFYYSIAITFWSFAYFVWQVSRTESAAIFWCKALMMGAIFIPVLYARFIYRLVDKKENKYLVAAFYIVLSVFAILNFGDWLVAGVEKKDGFMFWPVAGEAYIYYLIIWFSVVIYSIYLLYSGYRSSQGSKKIQLLYILLGTIIGYAGGATNYPLWFNIPILPWGNILITFYAMVVSYAIVRYGLLRIKILATEALAIAIFFGLLIDAILSTTIGQFLIRLLFVALFSIAGYQLIRSVFKLELANKQLEEDKRTLKELDRMKDEFLQMATHELNTPITVIQGKLDMAINEDLCKLTPEQKKFFTPVFDDTMRLAELSKDILNVARIDQHRLKINAEEDDLGALISKIVKSFEVKAKEKENSIAYIPMSKELPKIKFDQSKIGEVITNLINNANKFTNKGKIAVTSKLKDGEIIISVADTGIGINKEDQEHLFQKFYQVGRFDPDNPQEQQGSGLGLYISKNIIELHGGKMWLESEKGKGATFYFSLPLEYKEIKQPEKLHEDGEKLRVL